MTHLIRQQYLHVEFDGTEPEALALQRRLSGLVYQYLLPAVERTLDRHSTEDRHLCIERLELDAGALPLERLEYDLAASVAWALEKSLREELPKSQGSSQRKSAQETLAEAFLYFLKNGTLPWSFRLPEGRDLEQALLSCWQDPDQPESNSGTIKKAAPALLASATARKRLVLQFSELFLETMLVLLEEGDDKTVATVLPALAGLQLPAAPLKQFKNSVWETAFACVATGGDLSEYVLVARAWRLLPASAQGHAELASGLERHWPGVTGQMTSSPDAGAGNLPGHPDTGAKSRQQPAAEKISGNVGEHPEASDGLFVDNAGLVLLHPFLPRLLEALGITEEAQLLQPERALCLLHYLATGESRAPEYRLMLPKILCDVPLQRPVEPDLALTAAEREECAALLSAVVRHWGALGDCSADALRGTFLLRPGKLSLRQDGEWLLKVETRTCDILLEQLPWGISMVKLPWMPKMVWVEWS